MPPAANPLKTGPCGTERTTQSVGESPTLRYSLWGGFSTYGTLGIGSCKTPGLHSSPFHGGVLRRSLCWPTPLTAGGFGNAGQPPTPTNPPPARGIALEPEPWSWRAAGADRARPPPATPPTPTPGAMAGGRGDAARRRGPHAPEPPTSTAQAPRWWAGHDWPDETEVAPMPDNLRALIRRPRPPHDTDETGGP